MDKLDFYQQIITQTLTEISEILAKDKDCEALLCIDHARGQYILMSDGWTNGKRYYHSVVHLEIRQNNEVWLRADNTDLEVGKNLIEKGIDKNDMIPAFYSPLMRQYAKST